MSQQQKDALEDIIRNAPLDIGGDPIEQVTAEPEIHEFPVHEYLSR